MRGIGASCCLLHFKKLITLSITMTAALMDDWEAVCLGRIVGSDLALYGSVSVTGQGGRWPPSHGSLLLPFPSPSAPTATSEFHVACLAARTLRSSWAQSVSLLHILVDHLWLLCRQYPDMLFSYVSILLS